MNVRSRWLLGVFLLAGAMILHAEERDYQLSLSRPGEPAHLRVRIDNGTLSVSAHDAPRVDVEMRFDAPEIRVTTEDGMSTLPPPGPGLFVDESNNRVIVNSRGESVHVDVVVRVPPETDLALLLLHGGDLRITGVRGSIEARNMNGSLFIEDAVGGVVGDAINGELQVGFAAGVRELPLTALTGRNGDIELTLPANARGTLRLTTVYGHIRTEFDVDAATREISADDGSSGSAQSLKAFTVIPINGGGNTMTLVNLNNDITVRTRPGN